MSEKKSWLVTMRVTKKVRVVTDPCTEEQAHEEPYRFAAQETDDETSDYDVISVEPNE